MALLKLKVRLPPSNATRQTYEALWRQATWVRGRVGVRVRTYEALWRQAMLTLTRTLTLSLSPVSYTHLTLPTKA